jgi:translocation and assembly module TamB
MNQDSEYNSDKQVNSGDYPVKCSPPWRKQLRKKIFMTLALLLLGGTGSGLIYSWYFIQRKLIPLIETEASDYLHRPLELGELRSLSLTKASFGKSALPATEDNPDFIKVKEVKINLSPWYFLRHKELNLDLILVKPDVYLEQDQSKLWTPTDFGSGEKSEGGIKVNVKSIQLEQGQLSLVAYNPQRKSLNPAVIANIDEITIRPQDHIIKFDAAAELLQGGKFSVAGQGNSETDIIDLEVIANQLKASEVSNLLALPIELGQGSLKGNLRVILKDQPLPELQGALALNQVSLQIPGLVKPFSGSQGKLRFRGSEIELERVATNFGEVSGLAAGSLNLAGRGAYQIKTQVKPVAMEKVIDALKLESPIPLQGKIAGDVAVTGNLENPLVKFDLATTTPSRLDQMDFKQIDADLELVGTTLNVRQFNSLPKGGGAIVGNGKLQLDGMQNLAFNVQSAGIDPKAIARSYDRQLPVDMGRITGQTKISAQAGDLSTLRFRDGAANFELGHGRVSIDNLDYGKGVWSSKLTASSVEFDSLPIGKGSTPTLAQGLVTGVFDVSGTKNVGNLHQVKATGQANLNTIGGNVDLPKITIAQGNWRADTKTQNLKLQRLFPDLPDEFNDNLGGDFYLTGNIPDQAQPKTLINGFGDLALAQGKVRVDSLKIVEQDWTAIAQGTNLQLKELSSSTPEQFAGLVNGKVKLTGTTDNITPDDIKATGNGSLTLPEGVFQAEKLAIANGQFNAQVVPQQVDLSLFADSNSKELELQGKLGGQLTVTGQVDNLSPTAVNAKGNLSFSEGIDLLEQPLSAAVVWNGQRLDVLQAQGNGLDAQGQVVLDPSFFSDLPDKLAAVDYFEFDVTQAQGIDLNKLRLPLPNWAKNLDYTGRGDFAGKIKGTPAAMTISGNFGLNNFLVEGRQFAPFLAGNVQVSPETGVKLRLQEVLTTPLLSRKRSVTDNSQALDKIELVLDPNFAPLNLAIAQDDLRVAGTGKKELLNLTTANVPLEWLKTIALKSEDLTIPENIAPQPIKGNMSGDFSFNLQTLAVSGSHVVIDNPALASIRGDRLEGDFQYVDGYFAIQDVKFKQRDSIYQLKGNLSQKPDDLELDGQITVNGGQIQDILVALQIFELNDFTRIFSDRAYGQAAHLYQPQQPPRLPQAKPLFNVGFKDAPIIDQLQLLAAIQATLAAVQEERQTALVPEIKNLRGTFDGKIDLFGSLKKGITSEFNFVGQKWCWGSLVGDQIIAQGNLRSGILTLLPISVQLQDLKEPDTTASQSAPKLIFTGTFGGSTQSGQFRLVDMPMKLIEQLFSFPPELAVDGLVNATASIAGNKDNPQGRGEIRIDNASLNDTSIQSTKGSFNYKQSRLEFSASSIIAENADPLILKGSIPYQLPFAQAKPESDRLELQLNVQDKGLALLDIFSRGELKWIDGSGKIVLDITGILDEKQNLPRKLSAQGIANIKDATIAAKSLPKNLITNINSQVFFDLDNVRVNNFQGEFGEGTITASGTVPFGDTISLSPLTISFNDIQKVAIPKLYNGGVRGNLQILGKATEPNITGDLTLFDGTILLTDENDSDQAETKAIDFNNRVNAITRRNTAEQGLAAVTQYKNLKLRLGKDIQISRPPIFTFIATGNLDLNGTFAQPTPNGTIKLKRGQLNLFTTQLNLSRDYQNTARFSSNNVLDPFLDVLLVGSAIETSDRSVPSEVSPTEIPDSGLTILETIRISAKVKGLASQITQINNKIELTSSPPRSPAEIAGLLGGGFVEALTNSNGTSGLATLAGSALFGSLNAEFNNIFPIGELRLFPTPIIDENRDNQGDGLAGEIAFDLINNLSFSVLKILNNDTPAQFGFRYRLDDNFVLRGSSNFQEDGTRGLLEYELRF